ncbi:hypothetical protein [Anatilimnocola floriformis]|uniref:hypothetical protein n=1 Tax=Anatilimnocola floriformis TaxID=2948575 RepID=UPI0020C2DDA9|nr:hypothetical protein [Anatilimnocola floriformis]
MRTFLLISLLSLSAALLTGCGGTPPPPPLPDAPTPLKLEEWRVLPIEVKYDGATFERLRMAEPQLQNDRAWQVWFNQNVIPERKKDIPTPPGQQPP